MPDNYRERDSLVGGTSNPWNSHATFEVWQTAADFDDTDPDDIVDARAAYYGEISDVVSTSDLAVGNNQAEDPYDGAPVISLADLAAGGSGVNNSVG